VPVVELKVPVSELVKEKKLEYVPKLLKVRLFVKAPTSLLANAKLFIMVPLFVKVPTPVF
jgi:hypothetical protein